MIVRKSQSEIEIMREAGRVSARALRLVGEAVADGITTGELDRIAEEAIRADGGVPAFKGYHGFPKTLCTSINCQVVHGIPSDVITLREGDIVSVDVGAIVDGYYGDNAATFRGRAGERRSNASHVGDAKHRSRPASPRRVRVTTSSTSALPCRRSPRAPVSRWCGSTSATASDATCTRIRTCRTTASLARDRGLKSGMVLAIEPMVNAGGAGVESLPDGWTVVTRDGRLSAHFEHTVAITAQGPQVLTVE